MLVYGYNLNLINSNGDVFELTPEDHSVGVYDGDMKEFGFQVDETRINESGFSRISDRSQKLTTIKLKIHFPIFGAYEGKQKIREMEEFIAANNNDLFLEKNENGLVKKTKIHVLSAEYANPVDNEIVQEYELTRDTPWYKDVVFASKTPNPEVPEGTQLGMVFNKMDKSVIFNVFGNSVLFDNSVSGGFQPDGFEFEDTSLSLSNEIPMILYLRVKPLSTMITYTVNNRSVTIKFPQTLVGEGGRVIINTIPLSQSIYYESDLYHTKLTPYITDITVDPFVKFDSGKKNSFSVSGAVLENVEILEIDEGR